MLSMFLNPWTFIAGGLLISTPIIIHLINRIRFRRVKWAAMEFLLKAQKKMRRRKILEQLLLLLLRCLLVFFVGVLFARFIGFGNTTKETRPTAHIVILDDTPSMADAWRREDGGQTDAFSEGKRLIAEKLMPAAAEATTKQTMQLVRLSDLDQPFPQRSKMVDGKAAPKSQDELAEESRVNGKSITAMDDYLKSLQVSTVRRSLVLGLRKAKEMLDQVPPSDARIVHVVSDLRAVDWNLDGQAISDLIRDLKENGATVHLIDVGHPARKPDRKSPPFNDNVAIVELKPRNRIVSANQQIEIEVRVKNYGSTDLKDVRIDFYLNDKADIIRTIQFATLPANQESVATTRASFTQTATKERPLDRFNLVTAVLGTPEPNGLRIDNARYTVVEVRDTLKVLVVDGRTAEGGLDLRQRPEGDSYYLRNLLLNPKVETKQGLGNIDIVSAAPAQLDKLDLRQFATIYLMNVPTLSETAVSNIEKFVSEGGGVGVFLGQNVLFDDYTTRMYRNSKGFFPVPLQGEKEVTEEQKILRTFSFSPRLMPRNPAIRSHPALLGVYTDDNGLPIKPEVIEKYFPVTNIDKHWQVSRRGAWRDDKSVQELYCLPNDAPIAEYEAKAENLVSEIRKRYDEPKFEKARKVLDDMLPRIQKVTKEANPLSELARLLDQLLCDQINTGDASEPILRDFWDQPEMAQTKQMAMLLRDESKYGDPLYIVKQFGNGRVAVMTTDAGGTYANKKQWTDWPSLSGAGSWVPIVVEMQKYLAGGGDDANRSVGDVFRQDFDFSRYEPVVTVNFLGTGDPTKPNTERRLTMDQKPLGNLTMDSPANPPEAAPDAPKRPFQLRYADAKQPGAYLFTLTRKKDAGPMPVGGDNKPDPLGDLDFVGVPFNVDAITEGDLRRESSEELEKHTLKAPLHNAEDLSWIDELKQKPADMSSRTWLYLLILLLLIAEQAWAVRLSYHTKPEDLEMLAPSAAAAFAHHATPPPATSSEAAVAEMPVTSE